MAVLAGLLGLLLLADAPSASRVSKDTERPVDDELIVAAIGCEPKFLSCPGTNRALVYETEGSKRVVLLGSPDRMFARPDRPNASSQHVRLLGSRELKNLGTGNRSMVLSYFLTRQNADTVEVHVNKSTANPVVRRGRVSAGIMACGESTYTIVRRNGRWTCDSGEPPENTEKTWAYPDGRCRNSNDCGYDLCVKRRCTVVDAI